MFRHQVLPGCVPTLEGSHNKKKAEIVVESTLHPSWIMGIRLFIFVPNKPILPKSLTSTEHKISSVSIPELLSELPRQDPEWENLYDSFNGWMKGNNDDYVKHRIKDGLPQLTFVLTRIRLVHNPGLHAAQEEWFKKLAAIPEVTEKQKRFRMGFHGTRPENMIKICQNGLLKVGNPKNPSKAVDSGWFGDPRQGVYLAAHLDYCLKYSNKMKPLKAGEEADALILKCCLGRSKHIEKKSPGINATKGYDSHASPNKLEYYLFEEAMCVPVLIVTVRCIVDNRHWPDDGIVGSTK